MLVNTGQRNVKMFQLSLVGKELSPYFKDPLRPDNFRQEA